MFWRLALMKLFVDIFLLAVLTHDGWSFFTHNRKMLFIWQHGLRGAVRVQTQSYEWCPKKCEILTQLAMGVGGIHLH